MPDKASGACTELVREGSLFRTARDKKAKQILRSQPAKSRSKRVGVLLKEVSDREGRENGQRESRDARERDSLNSMRPAGVFMRLTL